MNSIEAVTVAAPAVVHQGTPVDGTAAGDVVATAAVLAHTLLNSIAVVRGGTELLARHHDTLPPAERHEWYRRVDDHAEFLALVMELVAQGRLAAALELSERGCYPESHGRTPRRRVARPV